MATLAKNPVLDHTGSHSVDDSSGRSGAEGIAREEVYLYFRAEWRGKPVMVSMSADRYAASVWDSKTNENLGNRLGPWRIIAREARYVDPEKNGERGEHVTGTARSALSELCEPLAAEWLTTDAYADSFQRAVARQIMSKFEDRYFGAKHVTDSLLTFGARLKPDTLRAISSALDAFVDYESARSAAFNVINEEES